jgi:16S rRNA (guanine(527)-N(7))-methyltransferase RsmG
LTFQQLLRQEFAPYSHLSDHQLELAAKHYELMLRWNAKMNLTRITSLEDSVRLHYCESFFLGAWLPPGPLRVVDIGSGPGFPGLPIAILKPEFEVTLIESNARKSAFLREASQGLPNIRVLPIRASDCSERFDWTVSRAVIASDVIESILSERLAILTSAAEAPSGWEQTSLPWGQNHVVAFPRGTVSRETSDQKLSP